MRIDPRYPSLYQVNTRVWLRRLSQERGKRTTLAEIDDDTIDGFARQGFDWIWLLSVWRTGAAGRAVSRSRSEWQKEFRDFLPDLGETTFAAPVSRSPPIRSATKWGAPLRWRGFANGSRDAESS